MGSYYEFRMPKDQPFMCYVNKRITDRKAEGKPFRNFNEEVQRCGPEWLEMDAVERAPYVRQAKIRNHHPKVGPKADLTFHFEAVKQPKWFTAYTNGVWSRPDKVCPRMVKPKPVSVIVSNDTATRIDKMAKIPVSIDNRSDDVYLRDLFKDRKPTNLFYVLVNCSYHCRDNKPGLYIPSEIGLTCFSFRKGIVDSYWSLADPVCLPYGKRIEAMENRDTFKIPLPPFNPRFQDYKKILNNIRLFLKRYKMDQDDCTNIYCISTQIKFVEGCFAWMDLKVGSGTFKFEYKIRSLVTLVQKLHKEATDYDPHTRMENILKDVIYGPALTLRHVTKPNLELTYEEAMNLIKGKTDWAFHEEFGCPYHRKAAPSGIQSCCLNIVNRYSMHIMSALSKKFGQLPKRGCHIPFKNPVGDVEKINGFLANWGYLQQCLIFEDQENGRSNSPDEDESWFLIERQKFLESHPKLVVHSTANSQRSKASVNKDALSKSLSSKPKPSEAEREVEVDWDDFFALRDGQEFIVEIVGDRLKEILKSRGRDHLFW